MKTQTPPIDLEASKMEWWRPRQLTLQSQTYSWTVEEASFAIASTDPDLTGWVKDIW
jgi:hypothetical protein